MYPKLFKIPFIDWSVPTYGLMMVIGFLAAVYLIRRLSRHITPNPEFITNACLYSLIAGVVGARLFYVVHYFDKFREDLLSVFAIWRGGLEFLGGVVLAIGVLVFYLRWRKLLIRHYFDILAIGLMLGLAFGRVGCFLIGDCFGKPTNLPWAIRFPYGSDVYRSQVCPDPKRNRPEAQLELPAEFFNYSYGDTVPAKFLKPYEQLTRQQKDEVDKGKYRSLPVHPTQLYSSVNAAVLCLILYFFRRRAQSAVKSKNSKKLFAKSGCTFSLMFVLYGITRFLIEFFRDDNPFEYGWWAIYKGGSVSQNLGIHLAIVGVVLMVVFQKIEPKVVVLDENNKIKTADKNS